MISMVVEVGGEAEGGEHRGLHLSNAQLCVCSPRDVILGVRP